MRTILQIFLKISISFTAIIFLASCGANSKKTKPIPAQNIAQENNMAVNIAIIMPLSGPEAQLGQECANMVKLGLASTSKVKLKIHTYDGSSPELLATSLQSILDDGVDIVIGPIYSEATKIASNKLKEANIPLISLSNNPALATPYSYIFGHAPMKQTYYLTSYFLQAGNKNYISLLPEGGYYTNMYHLLEEKIRAEGGKILSSSFYSRDEQSINEKVQEVVKAVNNANEDMFEMHKPVILVADEPKFLTDLLLTLKKERLDKKAIIAGDSRLDIKALGEVDLVFTGSLNLLALQTDQVTPGHKSSQKWSQGLLGKNLSFMHILAYDAGQIVAASLPNEHYNNKQFLQNLNSIKYTNSLSARVVYFVDSIAQRKYDLLRKYNYEYHDVNGTNNISQ